MDDLLTYKPATDFSEMPVDDDVPASGGGKRKREVMEEDEEEETGITPAERARILSMLAAEGELEEFDIGKVRKLALSLERKVQKNQQMRIKYPEEPNRFMDSEIALHEELQSFHVVATAPQYYPELIRLNTVETLIGLLSHENTDIAVEVVGLIQDMTDADAVEDSDEPAMAFMDAMLALDFFISFMSLVKRLNEQVREDADALHNALAIIENVLELKADYGTKLMSSTDFAGWSLRRLSVREFDANKLYVTEVLAILVQENDDNRRALADGGQGLDVLLQSLARFKKSDPDSSEETEMMENMFDIVCSCLLLPEIRPLFVAAEGVELMLRMLREKQKSRRGALKVLSTLMVGEHGVEACKIFVQRLGLKSLFPAFMKTPSNKLRKAGYSESEFEELLCTILMALLRNLPHESNDHKRVLAKFVESDYAKVQRLAELFLQYEGKMKECERAIAAEKKSIVDAGGEIDEELDNEFYIRRMDAGLVMLQMVSVVFAEASAGCGPEVRQCMAHTLKLKGSSIDNVKPVLEEYAVNVGDDGLSPPLADHIKSLLQYC